MLVEILQGARMKVLEATRGRRVIRHSSALLSRFEDGFGREAGWYDRLHEECRSAPGDSLIQVKEREAAFASACPSRVPGAGESVSQVSGVLRIACRSTRQTFR
jgi:hypothetical protein